MTSPAALPFGFSFTRDCTVVVAAVRPVTRAAPIRAASGAFQWMVPVQLTTEPGGDGLPHPSPVGERLAFVFDRALQGKMSLFLKDDRSERPVGDVVGTIEDMRWAPDGRSLIVLAADRALDGSAANGGQRLTWGEPQEPEVTSRANARRRLVVHLREGHGVRERDHQLDAWRRTIGWFDRHLGSPG